MEDVAVWKIPKFSGCRGNYNLRSYRMSTRIPGIRCFDFGFPWFCWRFRNPKASHVGCFWNPANNGITYQPTSTGKRRISEPSTVSLKDHQLHPGDERFMLSGSSLFRTKNAPPSGKFPSPGGLPRAFSLNKTTNKVEMIFMICLAFVFWGYNALSPSISKRVSVSSSVSVRWAYSPGRWSVGGRLPMMGASPLGMPWESCFRRGFPAQRWCLIHLWL